MNREEQLAQWRGYLERHGAVGVDDVDELDAHLRHQMADLETRGLDADEAFLIAVRRMGSLDTLTREFAREHSERLWKQLVLPPPVDTSRSTRREGTVMLTLAAGAAVSLRAALWLPDDVAGRNLALVVLPWLMGYFAWKRRLAVGPALVVVALLAVLAVLVNLAPYDAGGSTEVLVALHLPVLTWLLAGIAYAGGDWRSHTRRMDYVRFTGEWVVYYVLIALGGAVLLALTEAAFSSLDLSPETFLFEWVLPFGAAGAVLVAAWLVEAKQSVVENIAPVLTRLFTPLTTLMLLLVLGAFSTRPDVIGGNRELLVLMACVLVLVLGLLLYAISARDPIAAPGPFDWMQLVLIAVALLVDAIVLVAMVGRIAEFGWTANKVASLGLNLVLLVNLARAAWLGLGFVRGHLALDSLERWQTSYLPVYAAWATAVVIVLPPAFGYA